MNKLPKEKRDQLILVILLGLMALAGLYFGLIRYQFHSLASLADKTAAEEKRYDDVQATVKHAIEIRAELEQDTKTLAALEEGMATGDLNYWAHKLIPSFTHPYKVDIPQVSTPVISADDKVALLPDFPYKQAVFAIQGSAYYHDLGTFVADFENQFPQMRLMNMEIEPMPAVISGDKDREKLGFRVNVIALVKPNPS